MRKFLALVAGASMAVGTAVTSFAADPEAPVAITTEMLSPVVDGITANIGVILPVGISLFAIMLGIGLVPKLLKRFM